MAWIIVAQTGMHRQLLKQKTSLNGGKYNGTKADNRCNVG